MPPHFCKYTSKPSGPRFATPAAITIFSFSSFAILTILKSHPLHTSFQLRDFFSTKSSLILLSSLSIRFLMLQILPCKHSNFRCSRYMYFLVLSNISIFATDYNLSLSLPFFPLNPVEVWLGKTCKLTFSGISQLASCMTVEEKLARYRQFKPIAPWLMLASATASLEF